MTDDDTQNRLDLELEAVSLNRLNELGNQAIALKLIAGHGYHQGQYEIIRQGQVLTMTPGEAVSYLQALVDAGAE